MDVPQMAAYTHYETITTKERYEILDITERVERVRAQARLVDGLLLVQYDAHHVEHLRQKIAICPVVERGWLTSDN